MSVSIETLLLAKQLSGGGGGEGGTTNYNLLSNLPSINGVTLKGNKTLSQIGALAVSDISITEITGGHNVNFGGGNNFDVMDGTKGDPGDDGILSDTVTTIWTGTQAQYDAIATKDANTLYFIKEE